MVEVWLPACALGLAAVVLGLRVQRAAVEAGARQAYRITFPRELAPGQSVAFARSLSGLLPPWWRRWLTSPAVAIEARASQGRIEHVLLAPAGSAEYVLGQLRTALPGVRIEPGAYQPISVGLATELRTASATRELRADAPESAVAGLLATLQPLREGEAAVIQWVLTPAPAGRPSAPVVVPDGPRGVLAGFVLGRETGRTRLPAELVRRERDKQSEPQVFAALRVGVAAASEGRRRMLLRRLLGAFHVGSAPGVGFRRRLVPSSLIARRMARAAAPLGAWPCVLNATELAAFGAVPLGSPRVPGLVLGAAPQLAPSPELPRAGRVLGRATFPGAERPVALSVDDSLRHVHVIGPTGVGKSTLLLNLICADLAAGHGVIAIDPKGDLVADVLARVPAHRAHEVILLDPTDAARPVGFNLLAGAAPELVADQVVGLFRDLYAAFWGPRTDDVLRAALLTLTGQPGMTLAEVPQLLTDEGFRRRLVGGLDDHILEGFWAWYEALSPGERAQAIGPVLNKLRAFLLRRRLRNVVGQSESTFSLPEVLAARQVLLVSLAKGVLGEDAARLLGSAVLAQLWQAVQARAGLPAASRHPVFCFVDEFQDYVGLPTSFADLLAQARAYGFGLTLAHQHLGQLPAELRQAVLANARSRVIFQTAHADAAVLAKTLGPDVAADDLSALGPFEVVAHLMAGAGVCPPVTLATAPAPPQAGSAAAVRERSRQTYGRDAAAVEQAIRARAGGPERASRVMQRRRP